MDRLLSVTANVEDRHFWFTGLRRFAQTMLDAELARDRPLRVLDCGSGTGRNLEWLSRYGWAMGIELSPTGVAVAREHRRRVVRGTVAALPVPDASFDLATSFDVIYSLDDATETAALREMHRVVKPGGSILINAAALDILSGSHSRLSAERRRYTAERLRAKVGAAGFTMRRLSYTNMTTLPLTFAVRMAQRAFGRGDDAGETEMNVPPGPVNAVLSAALAAENALMRVVPLPAGSSVMCVARRD
jgi:SAM-dependent methyltransferase